jgi:branched-chain amino acid transport system substrate-binding protein
VKKYKEKFGEFPNENADNGYIAAYVAKEVLELAQSTDPEKIREAFLKINITQGPATIEGPIKFLPNGELTDPRGIITQNLGGKPVTVWPFNIAAEKVVYPIPKWSAR